MIRITQAVIITMCRSYLPVLRYTLENTTEVWANLSLQFAVTGQSFVDVGPFGDDVSSSCPVGNGQTQEFQLTNLEPGNIFYLFIHSIFGVFFFFLLGVGVRGGGGGGGVVIFFL